MNGRREKVQRISKKRKTCAIEAIVIPTTTAAAVLLQVQEIEAPEIRPVVEAGVIDAILIDEEEEGQGLMPYEAEPDPLPHMPTMMRNGRHFRYTANASKNYSDCDAFAKVNAFLASEEKNKKSHDQRRRAQLASQERSVELEKEPEMNEITSFRWPVGRGDPIYAVKHDEHYDGPYTGQFAAPDEAFEPNFERVPLPRVKQ